MSFVKTLINTNGTLSNPPDMDTITLRNNAITTALIPYDTIALRQSSIISSLLPYDLISQRIAAITSAFNGFLTTNNLYTGTNSFFNTIIYLFYMDLRKFHFLDVEILDFLMFVFYFLFYSKTRK